MDTTDHDSTDDGPAPDFGAALAETATVLFAAGSLENTLQTTVDLAVATIDGCDFAGLFILAEEGVQTLAHSDSIVIEVDALQHRAGEGPCLDAIAEGATVYADDLLDDTRWPRFGPEASAAGIRSALAIALSADATRGALNLYASFPAAFSVLDRANAHILATLAGFALSGAESRDEEERRIGELRSGLISREVIGQAQGILMERERITADQAFDILRRASQRLNVKLRDVAQNLVDTGERPRTEGPSPKDAPPSA